MKIRNSLLLLAVVLALSATNIAQSPKQSTLSSAANPESARKISVLNPAVANAMVPRLPLSPRLGSLEAKTIYMVDIGWGGPDAGYDVLEVIAKHLAKEVPGIKTMVLRKKGSYMTDDPELWKEIREKGHAAILGLSC